jgi:hypothetical protein
MAAGKISYSSVNRVLFVPGLTVLEVHYAGHTSAGVTGAAASSSRLHYWVESLISGLGIPSAIWAVSRVISVSIPAAVHGSPEERVFYWLSAGVVVEWLFVGALWFVLWHLGLFFREFGV